MLHACANKLPRGGRGCVRELAETPPRKSCLRPCFVYLILFTIHLASRGHAFRRGPGHNVMRVVAQECLIT